jgi:hypothetical protein
MPVISTDDGGVLMSKRIEYDDDAFRKMWAEGVSTAKMATRFKSSKSAISIHAARLGLKPRQPGFGGGRKPPIIPDNQTFKDAWASKLSYAEIGKTLGCSGETVKRAGIKYCYPKRNLRPVPIPKPEPKVREGVRMVGLVSLVSEPWAQNATGVGAT